MKLLAAVLACGLCGCNSMSNKQIVEEVKFCEANGMKAVVFQNDVGQITAIRCWPKETK